MKCPVNPRVGANRDALGRRQNVRTERSAAAAHARAIDGFRASGVSLIRHAPRRRWPVGAAVDARLRLPITYTSAVAAVGPCYPQSRPVIAGLH